MGGKIYLKLKGVRDGEGVGEDCGSSEKKGGRMGRSLKGKEG